LSTLPFSFPGFEVQQVWCGEAALTITARAISSTAHCPSCQHVSRRIHSYYLRSPQDLPISGQTVRLILQVRRFRCQNRQCPRRTFGERLPEVLPVHARRTARLEAILDVVAVALSGQAGERLVNQMGMGVSADTLLRLARRSEPASSRGPRFLGVDDFAFRRGRTYGAILVDLSNHRPIDLLPDRSAEALSNWLKHHPGVEWISRDRSTEFARGASEGAPQAQQVLDRWHVLKNLREALERMLNRFHEPLAQLQAPSDEQKPARLRQKRTRSEAALSASARLRRLACYEQVVALHQQGESILGIARHLHLSRQTVRRFVQAGRFPERARAGRTQSLLDPFRAYLQQRWAEGCHTGSQLWREIVARGFTGGYMIVYRWMQVQRETPIAQRGGSDEGGTSAAPAQRTLEAPRHLAWLLVRDPTQLDQQEQQMLSWLCQDPQIKRAYDLAQQLIEMMKERTAATLEAWLLTCLESGIVEIANFAHGLQKEFSALRAALTCPLSNGPVEGNVTKLKFIKRSMYGRGSFELLRQRVLKAA
jgi:transposase